MEQVLGMDDLKLLRKNIKSFINQYIKTAEQNEGASVEKLPHDVVKDLQKKAQAMGLWCLNAKQEWGGTGLTIAEQVELNEEMAKHRLGFYNPGCGAFGSDFPSFLKYCTKHQIEKYVKPSVQTGNGCYLAIWEQTEVSDLTNLSCSVAIKGDKWTISGRKSYVTNVDSSEFGVILVNCEQNREKKPTLFILDQEDKIEQNHTYLIDVRDSKELIFDNLELDNSRIIGEIGLGLEYVDRWIKESQLLLASRSLGIALKAQELAAEYALMRVTRGKTLSEYPTIQTMLAKSAIEIESTRLLVREASEKLTANSKDSAYFVQMAKLTATEAAFKIVDRGLQIYGGAGYTRDFPFERWYKELRIARLDHASTEFIYDQISSYIFKQFS